MYGMSGLPDRSNFFGSIHTRLAPEDVARLFAPRGWAVRKCSRTDYRLVSGFAELVIEFGDPVLIHGPVADVSANCHRVVEPLAAAGLSGTFECYDDADVLLLEGRFGSRTPGG